MKRLPKVATEMALHVLAYNLTGVMNIIGTQSLMAAIRLSQVRDGVSQSGNFPTLPLSQSVLTRPRPGTDMGPTASFSLAWLEALRLDCWSRSRSGDKLKKSFGRCGLLGAGRGCARKGNARTKLGRQRHELNTWYFPNFT